MHRIDALEAEVQKLNAEAEASRARADASRASLEATVQELRLARQRKDSWLSSDQAAELVAAGVREEMSKRTDARTRLDAEIGAHVAAFEGLKPEARTDAIDPLDQALRDAAAKREAAGRAGPPANARVRSQA